MKTLYESILDVDKNYDDDILINLLFSKDIQLRRKAFNSLLSMIESYHPKQHKNTAKMKSSDSYFIEFTRPIKIENHEATEILDYITYIQVCKQKGLSYTTVCINAGDEAWNREGSKINVYELSWRHTQPNFNPKSSNTILYEVPEELNGLFKRIQIEAYNHR